MGVPIKLVVAVRLTTELLRRYKDLKDEQLQNVKSKIELQSGRLTTSKEIQFENAPLPIYEQFSRFNTDKAEQY